MVHRIQAACLARHRTPHGLLARFKLMRSHVRTPMMKTRIKADSTLPLNQATLIREGRSLLIPTRLPVNSNRPPCYVQQLSLLLNNRENGIQAYDQKGEYLQQIGQKRPEKFFPPCSFPVPGR